MNRYRNLSIISTLLQVKMKKATGKGIQLGSYFEKKDGDDLSADDIIPEVLKPWSKPEKSETVLASVHQYHLICSNFLYYLNEQFFMMLRKSLYFCYIYALKALLR